MAVTLTGSNGLFTRLGKLIHAMKTIGTAEQATVPTEIDDYIDEVEQDTSSLITGTLTPVISLLETSKNSYSGSKSTLRTAAQNLLIEMVDADNPLPTKNITNALKELITQMVANSDDVDASSVGGSISADAGNTGAGAFVMSVKRGDGKSEENLIAESLEFTATGSSNFSFKGESKVANLDSAYPDGSGASGSVSICKANSTGTSAGTNLLLNGSFDTVDTKQANYPADWDVDVGTLGTTLLMTNWEVQTVAISGSPTSGVYQLAYTNADSEVQRTEPLAYNAAGSTVASALKALKGLADITLTTSGTDPNFTHTITFKGPDVGNITQLTSTENFDVGSIAHATTTAGDPEVMVGRALEFAGNASENTEIRQTITSKLSANDQLAFCGFFTQTGTPSTGVLTISLDDGSDTTINDDEGTANSFTIDCTALTTSFVAYTGVFRIPDPVPDVVMLRIRASTAISSADSVFLDHLSLTKMKAAYNGGPQFAIFEGSVPFIAGDKATAAPTNDRAGEFQDWFDRLFDMRQKKLLLPSDSGGTETVADSLIG